MSGFYGQDRCLIDANGRIKLSPRLEMDFRRAGAVDVVLHCVVEGALAVYPVPVWEQIRAEELKNVAKIADSILARRQLRILGAMTQMETISNQARITVPPTFREFLELEPGKEAMIVGCEIGIEIWNAARWKAEAKLLAEREKTKTDAQMRAGVVAAERPLEPAEPASGNGPAPGRQ